MVRVEPPNAGIIAPAAAFPCRLQPGMRSVEEFTLALLPESEAPLPFVELAAEGRDLKPSRIVVPPVDWLSRHYMELAARIAGL